jgi:cyclophilin family peptidyl-prolyl cis-trans isomerase
VINEADTLRNPDPRDDMNRRNSVSKQYSSQPEMVIDTSQSYSAVLHTNHGDIAFDLLADRSPVTVNNFVFLAREGFYDNVIFHRVIPGFMLQGGDPTGTGTGGPGYRFNDETDGAGEYSRGTVAMANSGPNTNGSQFFVMHSDYGLPHSYTIFGNVTSGLEAVDAIASGDIGRGDRPTTDVVISSVDITES